MIAVCGVLILAIVLFSVVVIYNIFQVGIANKIQEYGKIKALGATKKQMKQLIFREGMFLSISSGKKAPPQGERRSDRHPPCPEFPG